MAEIGAITGDALGGIVLCGLLEAENAVLQLAHDEQVLRSRLHYKGTQIHNALRSTAFVSHFTNPFVSLKPTLIEYP